MLLNLFGTLRNTGVPCTLREFLDLLAGLEKQLVFANSEDFYYLSRATLVKDEKHYDKFDRAFDIYFKGLETLDDIIEALVPEDWLRKEFEKFLSEDELKKILEDKLAYKTTNEWVKQFENLKIPCGPIYNIKEAVENPQVKARNMIVKAYHKVIGEFKLAGNPIKMSSYKDENKRGDIPDLDEHRNKILKEFS